MTYDVACLSKYIILGTAAAAAPATPTPATDAFPKISVGIYIPERSVPPISKSTTSKSVGFTVDGGNDPNNADEGGTRPSNIPLLI